MNTHLELNDIIKGAEELFKEEGNISIRINDEKCWLTQQIVARSSAKIGVNSSWSIVKDEEGRLIHTVTPDYQAAIKNMSEHKWRKSFEISLSSLIEAMKKHQTN